MTIIQIVTTIRLLSFHISVALPTVLLVQSLCKPLLGTLRRYGVGADLFVAPMSLRIRHSLHKCVAQIEYCFLGDDHILQDVNWMNFASGALIECLTSRIWTITEVLSLGI
jgi:hypothetical protein